MVCDKLHDDQTLLEPRHDMQVLSHAHVKLDAEQVEGTWHTFFERDSIPLWLDWHAKEVERPIGTIDVGDAHITQSNRDEKAEQSRVDRRHLLVIGKLKPFSVRLVKAQHGVGENTLVKVHPVLIVEFVRYGIKCLYSLVHTHLSLVVSELTLLSYASLGVPGCRQKPL